MGSKGGYLPLSGGTLTPGAVVSWSGRANIQSPADGVLLASNAAGSGFTRLVFGTNDASGAALKKNGAGFDVIDGNDGNFTSMRMASLTIMTNGITTPAPTGSTAAAWKLGAIAAVSPTSPNRTVAIDVGGTTIYLAGKTTND